MIDAAADAGADAVKFQNYRTEDFLADDSQTYEYLSRGQRVVESQFEMFKRCELRIEALAGLARHCESRGVIFFSTPTSPEGVSEAVRAGAPLLKNGSDYLLHLPLIRFMARSGLPTVLSTGMSTFAEIEDAVKAFREAGGQDLIVLHCTSAYPTSDEEVNLSRIPALRAALGCPVGFSDHTWGTVAATAAVALGACMVEKHFTISRDLPGPDQCFSSDPEELRGMIEAIRRTERCIGSSEFAPTSSEEKARIAFRLSCVSARELGAGHRLLETDIAFQRPATGLPPSRGAALQGRILARAVPRGHVFGPGDFVD